MDLGDIMLNEIRQTGITNTILSLLYVESKHTHTHTHKPIKKKTKETSSQIQRTDGWLSGAGVGEMGEGGQKVHTFRGIHL